MNLVQKQVSDAGSFREEVEKSLPKRIAEQEGIVHREIEDAPRVGPSVKQLGDDLLDQGRFADPTGAVDRDDLLRLEDAIEDSIEDRAPKRGQTRDRGSRAVPPWVIRSENFIKRRKICGSATRYHEMAPLAIAGIRLRFLRA